MNLPFFIAKRYLVSKKSHNAINIISGISIAGICIGTMALIIVLSAFNGISSLVTSLYNSFDPDIKITVKEGKTFVPAPGITGRIKKLAGVAYYSESLEENALLKYDQKQTICTIKGVEESFRDMTGLEKKIIDGVFLLKKDSGTYAVVGAGLAAKLNMVVKPFYEISQPLEVFVPRRGIRAVANPEDAFNSRTTVASGVFSLNDDFDYKYVLLPLDYVRDILQYKNEVSAIEIGLKPGADAGKVKEEITGLLGNAYLVKTRYEQNEVLFRTMASEKWWTFLILAFILLIATFNVIGSLTMLIIEKKDDIKTLSALGAEQPLLRRIFLNEGMLIVLTGAVGGVLLGLLLCWVQLRFKPVPFSEGFVVDAYPVKIMWQDLLYVLAVVLLIGFLAAWYPVRLFTRKSLLQQASA